jgi:hypothetical protein
VLQIPARHLLAQLEAGTRRAPVVETAPDPCVGDLV